MQNGWLLHQLCHSIFQKNESWRCIHFLDFGDEGTISFKAFLHRLSSLRRTYCRGKGWIMNSWWKGRKFAGGCFKQYHLLLEWFWGQSSDARKSYLNFVEVKTCIKSFSSLDFVMSH